MFVMPNFIREYAGNLLSIESDVIHLESVDFLHDLVERISNRDRSCYLLAHMFHCFGGCCLAFNFSIRNEQT